MNLMRTAMLLAFMTALFMAVGFLIGGRGGMMIALRHCCRHELLFLLEFRQHGAAHVPRTGGR